MQRYSKTIPTSVRTLNTDAHLGITPIQKEDSKPHQRHKVIHRLTPETIAQLVVDYETGDSAAKLMQRYHLGKSTVLRLLQDNGAALRTQRCISPTEAARAIELYRSGLSLRAVGDQLGFDDDTILNALKRAGVTRRPQHGGRQGST